MRLRKICLFILITSVKSTQTVANLSPIIISWNNGIHCRFNSIEYNFTLQISHRFSIFLYLINLVMLIWRARIFLSVEESLIHRSVSMHLSLMLMQLYWICLIIIITQILVKLLGLGFLLLFGNHILSLLAARCSIMPRYMLHERKNWKKEKEISWK